MAKSPLRDFLSDRTLKILEAMCKIDDWATSSQIRNLAGVSETIFRHSIRKLEDSGIVKSTGEERFNQWRIDSDSEFGSGIIGLVNYHL